jgi:hypothetical protein
MLAGVSTRVPLGRRFTAVTYEAAAADITALFRMRVKGLRHRVLPYEIPAAIRALMDEKKAALHALREHRALVQFGERQAQRMARAPPRPR